jgi:lipopolysaccharide/colanic/teichoic acid biosynthesis glycosyltransferase
MTNLLRACLELHSSFRLLVGNFFGCRRYTHIFSRGVLPRSSSGSTLMLKRIFDFLLSLLGLVLLSPLLVTIALLIKISSPGPVFYRGVRVGLGGKPFRIFKFRSMVVNADRIGDSSTPDDDPRITRIGRILRKHKLDELPQLINVLIGDMSLVGPRPQALWAVELYSAEEREVLCVRPGITDYASIRFANEGEILRGSSDPDRDYMEKIHPEKIRLGVEYARHHSFAIDCKIIGQTVWTVLFGSKNVPPLHPLPAADKEIHS